MYALARIQFQKLSCDHPHAAERTLYSDSVEYVEKTLGSDDYFLLLLGK